MQHSAARHLLLCRTELRRRSPYPWALIQPARPGRLPSRSEDGRRRRGAAPWRALPCTAARSFSAGSYGSGAELRARELELAYCSTSRLMRDIGAHDSVCACCNVHCAAASASASTLLPAGPARRTVVSRARYLSGCCAAVPAGLRHSASRTLGVGSRRIVELDGELGASLGPGGK